MLKVALNTLSLTLLRVHICKNIAECHIRTMMSLWPLVKIMFSCLCDIKFLITYNRLVIVSSNNKTDNQWNIENGIKQYKSPERTIVHIAL